MGGLPIHGSRHHTRPLPGVDNLFDDTFLKKKRLLARRDTLLEEIGQAAMDAGNLPSEFARLPQEFHGIAALLSQLKDRYRCLIEERDRVNLDIEDFQRLLHEKNKTFEKMLKPHQRDCDQLRLKLDYLQDQMQKMTRAAKAEDEFEALEGDFREADTKRAAIFAEWQGCRKGYQTEMAPLNDRFHKLELAIGKNREEAESLSTERCKRLRDLGHWHSCSATPMAGNEAKYTELEQVRRELADTRRVIQPEKPVVATKKDNGHWNWLVAAALVAALIGYFFRTEFRQENLSLAGFTGKFMAEDKSFRLFADLNQVKHDSIAANIPELHTLPGGEAVFRDVGTRDLAAITLGRVNSAEGRLLYCGLKFRKPPTRFSFRLTQLGWSYETTQSNYKALSNDQWLWLILNERTFFLLPASRLTEFEAQKSNPGDEILKLVQHIAPYDNSQALLQGFDTLSFTLKKDFFRLSLWSRTQILADLELRMRYVRALNLTGAKVHFSFAGNRLNVTGDGEGLPSAVYSGPELRSSAMMLADNLLKQAKAQLDYNDELELSTGPMQDNLPTSLNQKVRVYDLRGEHFNLVSDHAIGTDVSDLDWHYGERGLLITDIGSGRLLRYRLAGGDLRFDRHLVFGETTANHPEMKGFIGAATIISPHEDVAVVLEASGENKQGKPRVVLVKLPELTVLSVEEMPKDVRACLSAAWDKKGEVLYLGCATRKRRGKMGPAVLVYRRDGAILNLTRLIERPYKRGALAIPSLVRHPHDPILFFHQLPEESLVRYHIESGGEDVLALASNAPRQGGQPKPALPTNSLLLNRTGERVLVLGPGNEQQEDDRYPITIVATSSETLVRVGGLMLTSAPDSAVRLPFSDRFCLAARQHGFDPPTAHGRSSGTRKDSRPPQLQATTPDHRPMGPFPLRSRKNKTLKRQGSHWLVFSFGRLIFA